MRAMTLEEFVKEYTKATDLCSNYKNYDTNIQMMLNKIFNACWRFNLRAAQITYILNEALSPFVPKKNLIDVFDVLEI